MNYYKVLITIDKEKYQLFKLYRNHVLKDVLKNLVIQPHLFNANGIRIVEIDYAEYEQLMNDVM